MRYLLLFGFHSLIFGLNAQNALYIPPTISGSSIDLNLQMGSIQYLSGNLTNTYGANGPVLGPTIILDKLQSVTLNVNNSLGEETTIHWHGLHVPAVADGGPHNVITDGATWSPSFTVLDKAGTFWYHPHLHMHTNEQVLKGIAGMIIVRDEEEAALSLPRTYGVDDFPVIVQTKAFDANNQILIESADDRHVIVNGTIDPVLNVPAQFIRLRLLNGSSERVYNFGFTNNQSFKLIATDGGLRETPLDLTRIRLSPGERAEIVLDMTAMSGQSIFLRSFATELENGIYGATNPGMGAPLTNTIPGYANNPLNGTDFEVLQINVTAPVVVSEPVLSIPTNLTTLSPLLEADANEFRPLILERMTMGGPVSLLDTFVINGQMFDMDIVNYYIPLNNIEVWEITNMTPIAHPFHIHDVQFYVLAVNNQPPPAYLQGRKDVILVPGGQGSVKFITKFEDYADDMMPYMYHCHMLTHEDMGMMGQFIVTENLGIEEQGENSIKIYPNPADDNLRVKIENINGCFDFRITDQFGRLVLSGEVGLDESINVVELNSGMYFLQIDGYNPVKFLRR